MNLTVPNEENLGLIVKKMVVFIHEYLFEDYMSRSHVVMKLNIKSNDVFTDFSRQIGLPPAKYINKLRMKAGGGLLVNTDEKVCDIAILLHRSTSQFNKQFNRIYGVTPNQYRMLHRKNNHTDKITG